MKKTTLAVLIVLMVALVATPCFAQEVEPDGMFSIEGTLWRSHEILFFTFPPFVIVGSDEMGFYKGKVYYYKTYGGQYFPIERSSYIDLLMVSIAYGIEGILGEGRMSLAIMQPIGIGVRISSGIINFSPLKIPFFTIGTLYKIEDGWTPPDVE